MHCIIAKNWKQNVGAPAQVVYANKLKEGAVDKSLKNSFKVYKLTIVSLGSVFKPIFLV